MEEIPSLRHHVKMKVNGMAKEKEVTDMKAFFSKQPYHFFELSTGTEEILVSTKLLQYLYMEMSNLCLEPKLRTNCFSINNTHHSYSLYTMIYTLYS
jgi:hypothetical protein